MRVGGLDNGGVDYGVSASGEHGTNGRYSLQGHAKGRRRKRRAAIQRFGNKHSGAEIIVSSWYALIVSFEGTRVQAV
jgi:hypothetical protein